MSWDVTHSKFFFNLTYVTQADEDYNLIPVDDANKAFQGNLAMQVAPPGGHIYNQFKGSRLVAKFVLDSYLCS